MIVLNNMTRSARRLLLGGLLALVGCIDRYDPQVKGGDLNVLVVDGQINGQGVTTIRLLRSQGLEVKGAASAPTEAGAKVFIEEENGTQHPLLERAAGTYTSGVLALPTNRLVRLHFTTAQQREYASAYLPVKTTPAIDSVTWRLAEGGVQVAINTHDDARQSRYYRWDYAETWEFTSAFFSQVELKDNKFITRSEDIYHCWTTANATTINLASTVKLSRDAVVQQPLTVLPRTSEKLRFKYSILVKQYALTIEEYNYWEMLRKNTESIGTLFDPLPSQLTGNVQCLTDPAETVLGFVGAQSVTEKRIFINYGQLPRDWQYSTGNEACVLDTLPRPHEKPPGKLIPNPLIFFKSTIYTPVAEYRQLNDPRLYYLYSVSECVDCRTKGTNVRPSFWQ